MAALVNGLRSYTPAGTIPVVKVKPRPELAGFFALYTKKRGLNVSTLARTGGSDGIHWREYTPGDPDSAAAAFYGVADSPIPTAIPPQKQTRLDRTLWPVIAERARHESTRDLALEYGVSHQTIASVTRRTGEMPPTGKLA